MDNEKFIIEFVDSIKQKYGKEISLKYYFDDEDEIFYIVHNNEHLEYEDREFGNFVGEMIVKHLINNGVMNFAFFYDCDYAG